MLDKKRALAYIGGPRQLKDFFWYYLYKGKDYEWDLVCQPMFKEMKLKEVCQKAGIFHDIFMPDSFFAESNIKLAVIGLKMTFYWVIGKNKSYARREINKITPIDQYDLICVSTTRGVVPGMITLCAESAEIDILEDGLGDDTDENAHFELKKIAVPRYVPAFFFAKMNYFNIDGMFPLASTKRCNRYSGAPKKISKSLYKNVYQLYDMSIINTLEYQELNRKTFGDMEDISHMDAILFTTNLKDFTAEYQKYNALVCSYFEQKGYQTIALKKHPRDLSNYNFDDIKVTEMNPMIPAENIVDIIDHQDIYFMFPSTTIAELSGKGKKVTIIKFKELAGGGYYKQRFTETSKILENEYNIAVAYEEI